MKLIVNERDGCCKSIQIEYTPTEALIINHAMRRYVDDEEINEVDRKAMEQMLDVKPIFVDVAESKEQRMKRTWDDEPTLEPGQLAETYRAVKRAIEIQNILTLLNAEYQDTENGAAGEDVRWWNAGIRRAIEIVEGSGEE